MVVHEPAVEHDQSNLVTEGERLWDATAVKIVAWYFALLFFSVMGLLIVTALSATSSQPTGMWPFF
jgi:hypothetical protein